MTKAEWFDKNFYTTEDKGNHRDPNSGLYFITASVIAKVFGTDISAFEAGCGQGAVMKHLQDIGLKAQGIDISGWAIENAVAKNVMQGDLQDLSLKEEKKFDLVYCIGVLEYLEYDKLNLALKSLKELAGKWLFLYLHPTDHKFMQKEYLDKSGRTIKEKRNWWENKFKNILRMERDSEKEKKISEIVTGWDCFYVFKKEF